MNANLDKIIKTISNSKDDSLGISIKDNQKNKWICQFSTLKRIKENGFSNPTDYLQELLKQDFKDITLFLKRKSGSQNRTIKDVRLKAPDNNTNLAVSNEGKEAVNTASNPSNMPIQNNTPMQNNNSMMGMMGNIPQPMLDMYSNAQNFTEKRNEAKSWKEKFETADKDLRKSEDENRILGFKIEMLNREIDSKRKPIVSTEAISMLGEFAPAIIGMLGGGSATAMNGAEIPKEIESFSSEKTAFLEMIKSESFTDSYCMLMKDVVNKIVMNPEFSNELTELIKH